MLQEYYIDTTENSVFSEFKKSVIELADTLPQWNPENFERCIQSSISSLFEEAGELSGLISKYRTRKNYFGAKPKDLEDFDKIREKFIDETGDLLWVIVCAVHCLTKDELIIEDILNKTAKEYYAHSFEHSLFDVIRDIVLLYQDFYFSNDIVNDSITDALIDLIISFKIYLCYLDQEYFTDFDTICKYNMCKLGKRYNMNDILPGQISIDEV